MGQGSGVLQQIAPVVQLYLAELLKMHDFGPLRFGQSQALLFSGRQYEPPVRKPLDMGELVGAQALEGAVFGGD